MDYGFQNFETVTLKRQKLPKTLSVIKGNKSSIPIRRTSPKTLSLMLCKTDKITMSHTLTDTVKAPIRQGDILGYEEYYLNGDLLCSYPVIADGTVKQRDISYYFNIIKRLFFFDGLSKV
jgi:D-alanyl-D-alanine carboxypeptidase